MPKDAALRAAMESMWVRGREKHTHPYYWAAFQVIGETAPLALPH